MTADVEGPAPGPPTCTEHPGDTEVAGRAGSGQDKRGSHLVLPLAQGPPSTVPAGLPPCCPHWLSPTAPLALQVNVSLTGESSRS